MKLKILIPFALFFSILASSCLKDTPFLDVANTAPVIEFGQSPSQGLTGPFLYGLDVYGVYGTPGNFLPQDTVAITDTAIALVLASPQVVGDTLQSIVAIDTTQISAYNAANNANLTSLPNSLYNIPNDTVNILPGYRVGRLAVTLNFPGIHNYALPLKIVGSYFLHSETQVIISSNSGTFMWWFK